MDVKFVASVSPIVQDSDSARDFYSGALGLPFEGGEGDYVFTERLDGVKHFGLWPLTEAAEACFGTATWPADIPVPQASVEFEVDDVAAAAAELQERGHRLLHGARTEPWTQMTARLLTPDGLLVAVCHTPWLQAARPAAASAREAFFAAADAARPMLASPQLSAAWGEPSALDAMTVGDVAAHLVRAVTNVVAYLARPAPAGPPISPAAYYVAVLGDPSDLTSAVNEGVRQRSRQDAEGGPQRVLERWDEAVAAARERLATEAHDRLVAVAHDLVLTIEDYLATRVVEILVHADDLAVSLRVDPLEPPATAAEVAARVLLDIARQRHGDVAVLRALSRRERAPASLLQAL